MFSLKLRLKYFSHMQTVLPFSYGLSKLVFIFLFNQLSVLCKKVGMSSTNNWIFAIEGVMVIREPGIRISLLCLIIFYFQKESGRRITVRTFILAWLMV